MTRRLAHTAFLVRDYDEAIEWLTDVLEFTVVEDTPLSADKRWVVVAPSPPGPGQGMTLLLARAANPEQETRIGNQTGGRVFLFLHTHDFDRDYARMKAKGVRFMEEPRTEEYGTVVVFEDLYGNRWDMIQPGPRPA